jgi:NAD(P)-dependent dehydrogenase (short-subunit alcohol dehydrogenase family)
VCRAALPHLLDGGGSIINSASTSAEFGHPWMAAYAASKGGILSMTRSIAVEYAKQGVRANSVCPGGVATPLHGQFRLPKGADPALLRSALPWNGYASPEQIAAVNAFLASDDAAYISGEDIRADGGASS